MEPKRHDRARALRLATLVVPLMLLISVGCGCASASNPSAQPVPLEPWRGPLQQLFDDSIHPAAVGLSLDGQPPQEDPLLRARSRAAEVVARVRVNTVTVDTIGAKSTYHLGIQVGRPPLMPAELPDQAFELTIRTESPSYGIVSSLESGLRGRTFIGFVRRFSGPHGPEVHWHLTADSAEVAQVISQTSMLDEVAQE